MRQEVVLYKLLLSNPLIINMKKLTVIIPTYNEAPANLQFLDKVFRENHIDCLIVDDCSDYPVEGAKVRHRKNKGYGASIKSGIKLAKGNYVAIIDADGQYNPQDLVDMWAAMDNEDMVIGKRINHQGSWQRLLGRQFLRLLASLICFRVIPDLNSGIRIFKKHLGRSYGSILCDEFSFTSSLTLAMLLDGRKVKWYDADFYERSGPPSTVHCIRHGLITLYQILRIGGALRTRKLRSWLRK